MLLTHDHHGDNLDDAGRALLAGVPTGGHDGAGRAKGRRDGAEALVDDPARSAGQAHDHRHRHAVQARAAVQPPIAGAVIGFALSWEGQRGALWVSGDTVLYGGVRAVARRIPVDVAVLHLGAVGFPITGPLRYSMTGDQAVALCALLRPRLVVPVHCAGWVHFREGRAEVEAAFRQAAPDVRDGVRWLEPGVPTPVS